MLSLLLIIVAETYTNEKNSLEPQKHLYAVVNSYKKSLIVLKDKPWVIRATRILNIYHAKQK